MSQLLFKYWLRYKIRWNPDKDMPERRWEDPARRLECGSEEALDRRFRSDLGDECHRFPNRNGDLESTHDIIPQTLFLFIVFRFGFLLLEDVSATVLSPKRLPLYCRRNVPNPFSFLPWRANITMISMGMFIWNHRFPKWFRKT